MSADEGLDAAELAPQNPKSGRLSHQDRERMLAMHQSGASHDEIAQALQRTTGLVKKTLSASPGPQTKKKKTSPRPTERATPSGAAAPARSDQDARLRHVFWLRAQTQVELELPADLHPQEAQRLANYLQSLPFGARPR